MITPTQNSPQRVRPRWEIAATWACAALAGLGLLHLLWSSYCAFTAFKFTLIDYGIYTNTLHNLAHGQGFRYLLDRSYLATHLSFSLAAAAPLFLLWDHPFFPAALQWGFLAGGALLLVRTGRKAEVPALPLAAVLLFFVAYPFTQAVMLSEFHGVSAYYLLVPWLHLALRQRRGLVWLPLLLLLGVREDAGFVLPPLLLWFALQGRWRGGWVWAAVALGYALLACLVVYPALNDHALLQQRPELTAKGYALWWQHFAWGDRFAAHGWLLLPALLSALCLGRFPALVFPLAAVAITLVSPLPTQHGLRYHYPAAAMALMTTGLLEAMCRRPDTAPWPAWRLRGLAVALALWTIGAHLHHGFIRGGGRQLALYTHPDPVGRAVLRAARAVPPEGRLMVPAHLSGLVANRAELMVLEDERPQRPRPDYLFYAEGRLTGRQRRLLAAIAEREGLHPLWTRHGCVLWGRGG